MYIKKKKKVILEQEKCADYIICMYYRGVCDNVISTQKVQIVAVINNYQQYGVVSAPEERFVQSYAYVLRE